MVQRQRVLLQPGNPPQQFGATVANYREINQDPRWHNWLRLVDPPGHRIYPSLVAGTPVPPVLHARLDPAALRRASQGRLCGPRGRMATAGADIIAASREGRIETAAYITK